MSINRNSLRQKHLSREGFSPLPDQQTFDMHTNDATIDIPLEQIQTSYSGADGLRQDTMGALQPSQSQSGAQSNKHFSRGRRHATGPQRTGKVGYDGEEDTVNAMGKIYDRILNFSVVTRYFLYVAPVAALIAIPIIIGATVAQKAKIGGVRIVWFFSWIEIVWASLWAAKVVAHYLPKLFQILAGVVSSGVRKYALVLHALEIPLSLVGWAVTSLATFMPIMTRNPTQRALKETGTQGWENIVQKVLGAAVVASLIFLAEKLIIQLISIDYHRKQFSFRIKESKHNVYLLGLLYEASRSLFPAYCNEFAEEDYIIADQLNIALGLSNTKTGITEEKSGSATPMRLIQDIGRYGDKITSAFGNVAHEITGKEVFNPNSAHSVVIEALEHKRSTEALAKRIWMSFVVEGKEALTQDDIADVMGDDRRTEAEEAFAALDSDGNGDISLDEMIMTIAEFSRERRSIASSMHDVDQAINVLDNLLGAVVFIAIVGVFIAFLNTSFVTTLATAGTALLSLSFVFSATCQEVLGSCIFVFVKHPYDVGDRVDLGVEQLVVEHISLLFTVFRRTAGANIGRSVQIPNIVLNTLWVENISRSKAMSEQLTIDVSFDTSFDDVQILKNELQRFVNDKDNSRDFQSQIDIGILGSSDQSKLQLQVEIKHKSNWANETVRQARRSKFMCALVSSLRVVPIYAPGGGADPQGSAANPSYSVAVDDSLAKASVAAAKKAKEGKRLVPTSTLNEAKASLSPTTSKTGAAGLSAHDNKILDDLTSRDPLSDPARDDAWASGREDSSTLGERQSIDRQDLEDVRGLLRRESTRGKRKPGVEVGRMQYPGVPTINEPGAISSSSSHPAYAQPQIGYNENQRPYMPTVRNLAAQQGQIPTGTTSNQTSPIEMRQVGRKPSNPFRKRSDSQDRKPISPTAGGGDRAESDFANMRPYSGV